MLMRFIGMAVFLSRYSNSNNCGRSGVPEASCVRHYRSDLFDATFNQFAADFDVIGEWCAGTQLPEPLFRNQIRKFPKAED